jgi:Xaa-Pro aminopeptidase
MGAKISAEMLKAQKLLRQGLTAAEAARKSGISKGAISKSAACQAIIAEVKAQKDNINH